jgi:hypothetical protein
MKAVSLLFLLALSTVARAGEGPEIDSQPIPCTVPEKPMAICARVTADGQINAARIYFRKEGAEFFNFVDMAFGGLNYCGTVPAPRAKTKAVEYYIEAIDDNVEPRRLSTYRIAVTEGSCEFPPIQKDQAKAAAITVHATNKKQGRKLDEAFDSTGVTFIPVVAK